MYYTLGRLHEARRVQILGWRGRIFIIFEVVYWYYLLWYHIETVSATVVPLWEAFMYWHSVRCMRLVGEEKEGLFTFQNLVIQNNSVRYSGADPLKEATTKSVNHLSRKLASHVVVACNVSVCLLIPSPHSFYHLASFPECAFTQSSTSPPPPFVCSSSCSDLHYS